MADGLPFLTPWLTAITRLAFHHPSRDSQDTQHMLPDGSPLWGTREQTRTQLASCALVPPAVPTLCIAALVEGRHWLVCRAGLKLHEIGTRMFAFGTLLRSRVNILPSSCSTKHVIHFFELRVLPIGYLTNNSKPSDSPSW